MTYKDRSQSLPPSLRTGKGRSVEIGILRYEVTFPYEEGIPEEYRGKSRWVRYQAFGVSTDGFYDNETGSMLKGRAEEIALEQLPEHPL